jgi:hypothetical protein
MQPSISPQAFQTALDFDPKRSFANYKAASSTAPPAVPTALERSRRTEP